MASSASSGILESAFVDTPGAPPGRVLDFFSAAAGGWSLGMHRAGFHTVAACELIEWRRILYAENNPGVLLYDDVRTLTAERLRRDLGTLPDIVVGSPPCQDISSANTKGKGVDGERSGLFFEAVRIIGEVRPRWFSLENSPLLRTRGADRLLSEFQALGYTVEPCVVGADDVGANHERKRSWLIGFDLAQVSDPDGNGRAFWTGRRLDLSIPAGADLDAAGFGHEGWRSRGHGPDGDGGASASPSLAADAHGHTLRLAELPCGPEPEAAVAGNAPCDAASDGRRQGWPGRRAVSNERLSVETCGDAGDARQERRLAGIEAEEDEERRRWSPPSGGDRQRGGGPQRGNGPYANGQGKPDRAEHDEAALGEGSGEDAGEPWSDWNGGLADHLRLDDGLSAWVAQSRVAVGGPRGTAAASLLVEAFGDAVVPLIPEAIGRAILRTEAALAALFESRAA